MQFPAPAAGNSSQRCRRLFNAPAVLSDDGLFIFVGEFSSDSLKNIDRRYQASDSAVLVYNQDELSVRLQLYVPVIDRLMRVDPVKRPSNHQFMTRWPEMRAIIKQFYPAARRPPPFNRKKQCDPGL